jgi:hypothetical protein
VNRASSSVCNQQSGWPKAGSVCGKIRVNGYVARERRTDGDGVEVEVDASGYG